MSERLSPCVVCGLCCDGSLFSHGHLHYTETATPQITAWRTAGMRINPEGTLWRFELPCHALRGCLCSIYAERPRLCAVFRCKLLEAWEDAQLSDQAAETHVSAIKQQIAQISRELAKHPADEATAPLHSRLDAFRAWYSQAPATQRADYADLVTTHRQLMQLFSQYFYEFGFEPLP